jgi:ribosomal protein S18 acetylase RimI-like enzyme
MAITIERAQPGEAAEILALLKVIGGETDNLSFGGDGLPISTEGEAKFLAAILDSDRELFLTARREGELVGTAHDSTCSGARTSHRGRVGICIRRSAWGMGIGCMLMERLLNFAENIAKTEIVSLEVRSDNTRAIGLYKKFGFLTVGRFQGYYKVRGIRIDFDIMERFCKGTQRPVLRAWI